MKSIWGWLCTPPKLHTFLAMLGHARVPPVLLTLTTFLMLNVGSIPETLDMAEYFAGEMAVPHLNHTQLTNSPVDLNIYIYIICIYIYIYVYLSIYILHQRTTSPQPSHPELWVHNHSQRLPRSPWPGHPEGFDRAPTRSVFTRTWTYSLPLGALVWTRKTYYSVSTC